jgi:hypothetical protein
MPSRAHFGILLLDPFSGFGALLFAKQVLHVAYAKFVPDSIEADALKASAVLSDIITCPALPLRELAHAFEPLPAVR